MTSLIVSQSGNLLPCDVTTVTSAGKYVQGCHIDAKRDQSRPFCGGFKTSGQCKLNATFVKFCTNLRQCGVLITGLPAWTKRVPD